jgi:hypothetical protein
MAYTWKQSRPTSQVTATPLSSCQFHPVTDFDHADLPLLVW